MNNSSTFLSIIICTYNREKYIYNVLKSIAENDCPFSKYEIIIVNNNSNDGTEEECTRFYAHFPQVNYRYFVEKNQGLSFARNRGIAEAKSEVLVFLDDDAFVENNYLANLLENLTKYPDFAAFGGKISPKFESGIPPKWLSKWTMSWVSAIDLGEKTQLFAGNRYPIGANMGIKADILREIGNFNTQLGRSKKNLMGGEEKDIFNRIKAKNGKIYYFSHIEIQHIIPENRTTDDFIKRLGLGIGSSEKIRTLNVSRLTYFKRIVSEAIKWVASIILFFKYLILFQPQKGIKLLLFRRNVTSGLLARAK